MQTLVLQSYYSLLHLQKLCADAEGVTAQKPAEKEREDYDILLNSLNNASSKKGLG